MDVVEEERVPRLVHAVADVRAKVREVVADDRVALPALRHERLRRHELLGRADFGVLGIEPIARTQALEGARHGAVNQIREDVGRRLATIVAQVSRDAILPLIVAATKIGRQRHQRQASFTLFVRKLGVRLDAAHAFVAIVARQLYVMNETVGVLQELWPGQKKLS